MSRVQRVVFVLLCATACLATVLAAAPPGETVATMRVGSAAIDWEPLVDYERLVLTVSGPGDLVIRREFARGASVSMELVDEVGSRVPNGSYTYQLEAVPKMRPDRQRRLAAARERGDEGAAQRLLASSRTGPGGVQTGSFIVHEGAFVAPDLAEPRPDPVAKRGLTGVTAADQVIPDDLIVQGSACVGLDCVNNENFGFDTIRLKENNLRIKFEDTSTTAGFPTTDWQLTANDSGSGGQSKFSIEDVTNARVPFTVLAAAPTNSFFVDSAGRVGLGTATPVLNLHVATGNSPALRLEQNGSSGFTPQTWDIAGNEANFFIRDVTGGSLLPFRIRPGAPSSSLDISSQGKVGIGTAAPTQELTIKSKAANENVLEIQRSQVDNQTILRVFETTNGDGLMSLFNSVAGETFRFTGSGGTNWLSGTVGVNCNSAGGFDFAVKTGTSSTTACNTGTFSGLVAGNTTFTVASSRAMKQNLQPVRVANILDKVAAVDVYTYDFIEGPRNVMGLVAEDFHTVFGRGSEKMISGQEVEMALWLAVKELSARNAELSAQNSGLAAHQEKLEAELAEIRRLLQGALGTPQR